MPFEIPESWEWACFGDISEVVRGGSPRPAGSVEFYNGNIPFLKVADLTNDNGVYVYSAENSIKEAGLTKTRFVKAGTLLLTNSGATLGVPKITNIDTTFNDGIAAFLYLDNSIKLYSYWYLRSQTNNLRAINQGAGQPNLNTDLIKNLIIPLPPVAEQARIVSAIENMFLLLDYIENDKRALNDSIHVLKSKILDYAINGKLVPQNPNDTPAIELLRAVHHYIQPCDTSHYPNLPKGWTICSVGEVANYINGRAFKPSEWEHDGLPIIRIQNLNDINAPYNYTTVSYEDRYKIKKGDLLFAWAASLGTYIWEGGDAWLNQHIFKVEPNAFMDKHFLYYSFINLIAEFYRQSHGSGMVHITKDKFEQTRIMIPPLPEQKRIVQSIENIYNIIDTINAEL